MVKKKEEVDVWAITYGKRGLIVVCCLGKPKIKKVTSFGSHQFKGIIIDEYDN